MIKLKDMLTEELSPQLKSLVGSVLFGANSKIAQLQGFNTTKPNTKWENTLYKAFESWTNKSTDKLADYFLENKDVIVQLSKQFPEVLQPPTGKLAYRGVSMDTKDVVDLLSKGSFSTINLMDKNMLQLKSVKYKPKRAAQSWTLDAKTAFRFEGVWSADKPTIPIIYVTKINNDFIGNPALFDILSKFTKKEQEVIRVASEDLFTTFMDESVLFIDSQLYPTDCFTHKILQAKPYFDKMLKKYNKLVTADTKATSIDDILSIYEDDEDAIPASFDVPTEYDQSVKGYLQRL